MNAATHRQRLFGDVRTPECEEIIAQRPDCDVFARLDEIVDSRPEDAELTEEDVRTICELWFEYGRAGTTGHPARGELTQTNLADTFGVTNGTISKIVQGRTWKHLDIPCRDGE